MDKQTKLYWVKFVDQSSGIEVDTYFKAESISKLDEVIADIIEIKVIDHVQEIE